MYTEKSKQTYSRQCSKISHFETFAFWRIWRTVYHIRASNNSILI